MMERIPRRRHLVIACALVLGTCAVSAAGARAAEAAHDTPDASANDPIEGVNRGLFRFNDTLDVYAMEPVATAWDRIAPAPLQQSITNFFRNLRFPKDTINNLLQGKLEGGLVTVSRFVINSTIGFAGIWDPAAEWGLDARPEDFGQTLGRWGAPPGPYLMLPLLGPSNVRDTGGLIVDYGLNALPFFVNQWILFGGGVIEAVNARAQVLEEIRDAKEASLDYYVFVRNAYFQRREALVNDTATAPSLKLEYDLYDDVWNEDE